MRGLAGQSPTLRWVPGPKGSNQASVETSGLPDPTRLKVYAGTQRETPMAGTYRAQNGSVVFEPRFPLVPGIEYVALYGDLSAPYKIPSLVPGIATRVTAVYPTANTLPLNLLKFYLHFSAPMSRGDSYRHIKLRKANGPPVDLPFLEIAEELWNPEMTRLTLLFDPGRIKRGVKPLEDIGGALALGKRYTLEIAQSWHDGRGNPLVAPYRKRFTVGPADRTPIQPSRWRLEPPRTGTREPLTVHFNEPLDHALAQRLLRVQSTEGAVVLDNDEQRWRFTPTIPWQRHRYTLSASALLEDLAGNNIGKPFDVDTASRLTRFHNTPTLLPFTPR